MEIIDQPEHVAQEYKRVDEILQSGYSFRFSTYFNDGLEILKKNIGAFALASLIVFAISIVVSLIPFAGNFIGLFLTPGFYGGFILMSQKSWKGEEVTAGDIFSGFSGHSYTRALGAYFLSILGILVLLIPAIFVVLSAGPDMAVISSESKWIIGQSESFTLENPEKIWPLLLYIPVLIYLSVGLMLVFHFVYLYDDSAFSAIKNSFRLINRKWFGFFLLGFVAGISAMLGFIALCIGILFTYPFIFTASFAAFDHIMKGKSNSNPI